MINELSSPYNNTQYPPALLIKDFIPMIENELCDYYGVNIFPSSISKGLKISRDNHFGIYKDDNRTVSAPEEPSVYWEQNEILYSKDNKSISIEVSKNGLWAGICFNTGGLGGEKSIINGHELLVGNYIAENGDDEYYAYALYCDVEFLFTSLNISETEFIDTVASVFAN